jgi:hypothetical protein
MITSNDNYYSTLEFTLQTLQDIDKKYLTRIDYVALHLPTQTHFYLNNFYEG